MCLRVMNVPNVMVAYALQCFKDFHTPQNFREKVNAFQHLKRTTSRIVCGKFTVQ